MDHYKPQHIHPFTLEQAAQLDIPTITQEIRRLEHSLFHLKRTQDELREDMDADEEVRRAIEENELVIGSQAERIEILKMALQRKGVDIDSGHYGVYL